MKKFATLITILFTLTLALGGCNDHLASDGDGDNNNVNNVTNTAMEVETLSPSKTALWVELGTGDYDFALTRERTSSDPDLVGHLVTLPKGLSAMVVTGEDQLIIEGDDLFEVYEVTDIGQFEMLVRNIWFMPAGWQPNLFPHSEGEAVDLQILLSAFICAKGLDLHSRGCQGQISSNLFRFVGETAYYEWSNSGHAKYVFIKKL